MIKKKILLSEYEQPCQLFRILHIPFILITKTHLDNQKKKIPIKKSIFHIPTQNIDCGYSLEPPVLYLSRNKKNNV